VLKNNKLLIVCILFLGLFLRLYGNNWDQGWHLHPDERFLTMVQTDVKIPTTFSEYLTTRTSSFNPSNRGHAFYVYGTLPVFINKIIAQQLYSDAYDLSNLQGRILSGLADFFVIIIIFKLVNLIEKKLKLDPSIKYISSFLYAIAVLPIQLSHFFTVDTFLNLFVWLSLYFAVKLLMCSCNTQHVTCNIPRCYMLHVICYMSLSGLFLGLAIACKVSAIYFAPLIGVFVLVGLMSFRASTRNLYNIPFWILILSGMTTFLLFCYFALRIGSPYYFETGNILNPQLSSIFIENIKTLKSFDDPLALFPPANQWIHASPFLSLTNLIFFGVGPVYFLFGVLGLILLLKHRKNKGVLLTIVWFIGFTLFQSVQFAKTMRYLIFIYPFLAFFAAMGLHFLFHKFQKLSPLACYMLHVTCYIFILVWPLAFMSLYVNQHSRVAASKWIYRTVPYGSTVLTEYWDDPLPLMVQDPRTRNYIGKEVHIFDPDTTEKWRIIQEQLDSANYYIMSSNRGWGSIPTTPERYPIATQFYKKMIKGEAGFVLVKEFTSYPSLRYLGIPIDFKDQWAEESFTVYDHPLVKIFKKK